MSMFGLMSSAKEETASIRILALALVIFGSDSSWFVHFVYNYQDLKYVILGNILPWTDLKFSSLPTFAFLTHFLSALNRIKLPPD